MWLELPLFPLQTVLFPGQVLPLHIFEERYKTMIERCLDEDLPFGVVLIREGQEVGGEVVPHQVGTTAVIAGVNRLEQGRMNIVSIGSERFRLLAIRRDLPYLVGSAERWPVASGDPFTTRTIGEPVRDMFHNYLELLEQAQGHEISIDEVPADPRALALLVAIALQVPQAEKQGLLAQASVTEILRAEHTILRREETLLGHIIETQEQQWEGGYSGYLSRN